MRSLVLGNGTVLVTLDSSGQVRDLYYPHVGLENHTIGALAHKIGVWADGRLTWITEDEWSISINYKDETLVSSITAQNDSLGIVIYFADAVYNEKNIFLRRICVKNLREKKRTVKIFFNQQFKISEVGRGDTAYYDPYKNVIVHYKGKRVFLIAGHTHGEHGDTEQNAAGFDDYSIGLLNIEGREGTWRDAEDGVLSKNPIEHGSVDSTIGFTFILDKKGSKELSYWIAVGNTIEEARELHEYVMRKTPEHLVKTTKDFWHAWVNKVKFSFHGLHETEVSLFKKSLLIVRTHVDSDGALIASSDASILQYGRDTYSYMWPRDGALSIMSLDKAGDANVAKRFFELCNSIIADEGYFMHKYRPDGSLGSSWHAWIRDGKPTLPIQEDETALVIYALWKHYELTKDVEFIEDIYNTMIRPAAEFMASYVDTSTGLPQPSYDLWEEKYGVHTYTASAVYGALMASSRFSRMLGKVEVSERYAVIANNMRDAILEYLWDGKNSLFYKSVKNESGHITTDKTLDMSSLHGIFMFNVLEKNDNRLNRAMSTIEDRLRNKTRIGGVPRYVNDGYYRARGDSASNPWFITTLWLAQCYIDIAKNEEDLAPAKDILAWTVQYSSTAGVLSEQIDPNSGEQRSVAPLTWSHSEYITTVIKYLEKLEELGVCLACYPLNDK